MEMNEFEIQKKQINRFPIRLIQIISRISINSCFVREKTNMNQVRRWRIERPRHRNRLSSTHRITT